MPAVVKAEDLLHDRTRLSIVALIAGDPSGCMTFTDVQKKLELTAGNLSSHLRTLEQHNLVTVHKQFKGRRPQTTVLLTDIGKAALQQFIEEMELVIQRIKESP